jgi:HEPN domain-containing protein
VTNRERADELFAEAQDILEDALRATEQRRWNRAARRAQEVVELVLKALLNEMGVDYPRSHDVAPAFRRAVRERQLEVDQGFLGWLDEISDRLAEIRGPAFYHEVEIAEREAREAAAAAAADQGLLRAPATAGRRAGGCSGQRDRRGASRRVGNWRPVHNFNELWA